MKQTLLLFLSLTFLNSMAQTGQSYESFFTGDTEDIQVEPDFGIMLAGGAGDNDDAMTWFLERANGGDVVVLRASGSDGYNDYFFSGLGVTINSVETILFNDGSASSDTYVLDQLANAEAIWIAGGDQWDYVSYWKESPVEEALNHHINVKGGVIGGTSAGMAILGGSYFNAMNGTVYSDESLEDPYNNWLHMGHGDFVDAPFLSNVVTDTHYDDPDRRGRHVAFMARMYQDEGVYPLGIACDEYSATCIDENGIAWCFGEYPEYDDFIYFIRPNCEDEYYPETCSEGTPLDWNRSGSALKVYRVAATTDGAKYFDLNTWMEGSGGEWQTWHVDNGTLNFEEDGVAPDCAVATSVEEVEVTYEMYPQPADDQFFIQTLESGLVRLFDSNGREVLQQRVFAGTTTLDVGDLSAGVYVLQFGLSSKKLVVR